MSSHDETCDTTDRAFSSRSQALRTIMFNTNSHLGRNAAVIIAWILMSCGTLSLLTWLKRWFERRNRRRAMRPKSPVKHLSATEKGKEKAAE